MNFIKHKKEISDEEFEQRKLNAINLIKDKKFYSNSKKSYCFTEQELKEFDFECIDDLYNCYTNVFFDGNFVFYPEEKLIWV
jgi:hypothetical protein